MTEQTGRNILLKVGDDGSDAHFVTLGGLRAKTITINNTPVDVSNADYGRWRKLLEGAGMSSISISGSGVFENDTAIQDMEDYAFDKSINTFQMVFGNGKTIELEAMVTQFQYTGDHDNAQMYSVSLESSGAPTVST